MVHLSLFAVVAFALSSVHAFAGEQQQQILSVNKHHKTQDPLKRVHKILRHHPLIDTHNDLPMYEEEKKKKALYLKYFKLTAY